MSAEPGHPILGVAEARALEERLFAGDESREWEAMRRAGAAVAAAVQRDFEEIGGFPPGGRVLVLAGKGHNAGDALIAAREILALRPGARAEVAFAFGPRALRPLAKRAWRDLVQTAGGRAVAVDAARLSGPGPDLCLDGVFGFQFRPPLEGAPAALLEAANRLPAGMRAAVDLPSGLGEGPAAGPVFRADFTYATGSVKLPAVDSSHAAWVGRLRYLDLGFFDAGAPPARRRILTPEVLAALRRWRAPESDKRSYGHLFIVGGSRRYPGAVLMAVLAALRGGAGLVTAFVPESLAPAFAARAPEAMWVGWPETPEGGLALEGRRLLLSRWDQASAIAFGPGLGREPETLALAAEIAAGSPAPLLIDADALQPDIVRAGTAPRILTPHLGEFRRLLAGDDFHEHPATASAVVVLKGRLTAITRGDLGLLSPFGGPVLARGGSGDLLAGLTGGLLAQAPGDLLGAACRGVVWHGRAADLLARACGQTAVRTTQLLDHLPAALRADVL
jgi:ADP-dependent NAD(P)H-hydrate dehydratase / NAD(P)H-hydrate epimerase